MAHLIPVELLTRIEAHERWLQTTKREGQSLAQGNMDLRDLDLSGRQLAMATLPDACFDRTVLRGANLSDSNLRGASFIEAILDGGWLVETDADHANFSGASLREVRGVSLEVLEADFRMADLTGGNFSNADFSEANLEYTNFSLVDLREAYFYKANMKHATLTGALLQGAELAGATGLELAKVEWIDIGEENAPQRLEGEQARHWLLTEAAKLVPKGATST
ncbi:MAG: pentapeptide repeat-containing protein [Chloroflexota bacterium]|nr:pentapeptide repeat-containing protein [Chloroflexota bacterium]